MGGRGSSVNFIARLPNYQKAEILNSKIKNYLLNPDKSNGKHIYFKALGYTMRNAAKFESDIRSGLKKNKAVKFEPNKFGNALFNVTMQLGIYNKDYVLTVWQIDKGANKPRFITAYKARKNRRNE